MVDASLLVEALTDDGPVGDRTHAVLAADTHWLAPEHLPVEVTSAVRGRLLGGKLTVDRADRAVSTLRRLTLDFSPWSAIADRVWELRANLTPYDASYVALAEMWDCPLVTTDRKLENCVVRRCRVELV